MSKVITFSRTFPAYHSKAGQDTFFPEKVIIGLEKLNHPILEVDELELDEQVYEESSPKFHTVRAGSRWKVGEMASLRVWSGRPYHTKQVTLAPDIKITNVWSFEIKGREVWIASKKVDDEIILSAATHDGLMFWDFLEWFKYPQDFQGQIICWNNDIEY
jgi:hypothetical protein